VQLSTILALVVAVAELSGHCIETPNGQYGPIGQLGQVTLSSRYESNCISPILKLGSEAPEKYIQIYLARVPNVASAT